MERDQDAIERHVRNFVETGVRRTADELVGARFPIIGPLAVEAAAQVYRTIVDDEDERP
jgi:hypothetical protein